MSPALSSPFGTPANRGRWQRLQITGVSDMDNATFVRNLLSDFLSIKPYDYFAGDHREFLSAISKTNCKVVELSVGAELVATPIWQDIGNPAASIAIKNFIADLSHGLNA